MLPNTSSAQRVVRSTLLQGWGYVSVEQYNQALANMAADGGFANDAMANLSETVEGKLSTAMDNVTKALGEFAEKSGLLTAITDQLDLATLALQRHNTTDKDARASMKKSEDLLKKLKDSPQRKRRSVVC